MVRNLVLPHILFSSQHRLLPQCTTNFLSRMPSKIGKTEECYHKLEAGRTWTGVTSEKRVRRNIEETKAEVELQVLHTSRFPYRGWNTRVITLKGLLSENNAACDIVEGHTSCFWIAPQTGMSTQKGCSIRRYWICCAVVGTLEETKRITGGTPIQTPTTRHNTTTTTKGSELRMEWIGLNSKWRWTKQV